jgi:membrane-associated phospholipid phosphatase
MPEHAYTAGALPQRAPLGAPRRGAAAGGRPGPAGPLLLAAGGILALTIVWLVAELIPAVQVKDAVALHDFTLLDGSHFASASKFLLHLLDPLLFTIWGIALVLIALARRRAPVAVAVATVMALAPFSADLLKPLLAHPHVAIDGTRIGEASWPSGHATAAATLAMCAVLVTPARRRPLVAALAAIFTLTVGVALLIGAWHMPSDVLGGYLLATLWIALALAGLRAYESTPSPPAARASA